MPPGKEGPSVKSLTHRNRDNDFTFDPQFTRLRRSNSTQRHRLLARQIPTQTQGAFGENVVSSKNGDNDFTFDPQFTRLTPLQFNPPIPAPPTPGQENVNDPTPGQADPHPKPRGLR